MIDLYYWTTPNGHKITIFLEEAQLDYNIIPINLSKKDQLSEAYLKINPNNKIPAIKDNNPPFGGDNSPIVLFESGAILLYLAEKAKKLIPQDPYHRNYVMEWLFWQMAGLGPMSGQANYYLNMTDEKHPHAIERFTKELQRLYKVLNKQLAGKQFIDDEYSIADITCYPWIVPHEKLNLNLKDYPHIERWFNEIKNRDAVKAAYQKAKEINPNFEVK